MRTIITAAVFLSLGAWAGGSLMRYNIAQMFSQGEGRALCEEILRGAQ